MARRGRKSRRSGGRKKIPLAIVAPMAFSAYNYVLEPVLKGDMGRAQRQTAYYMAGMQQDGSGFQLDGPLKFYGPMIAGVVAHKVAGRFVNRYIPKWLPVSI
jgi:hypothetical protein